MNANRAFATIGIVLAVIALVAIVGAAYMLGQRHPAPVPDLSNTSPDVSANNPGTVQTPAIDNTGTSADTQENGTKTAYIRRVSLEAGKYYLAVDDADVLRGKAAVQAALEAGDCAIEGLSTEEALARLAMLSDEKASSNEFGRSCTPKGFYIVNLKPELRKLEVAPCVKVAYSKYWNSCSDPDCIASLDLSELAKKVNTGGPLYGDTEDDDFKRALYSIEVLSGRIEKITLGVTSVIRSEGPA